MSEKGEINLAGEDRQEKYSNLNDEVVNIKNDVSDHESKHTEQPASAQTSGYTHGIESAHTTGDTHGRDQELVISGRKRSLDTESRMEKPGMAKIKLEYIINKPSPTATNPDGPSSVKKPKLKGRNKYRPYEKRPPASEKLCPTIIREEDCSFGSRCKFNHDIAAFMAKKPPDIADDCYVFETLGKCPQGVVCRFGRKHISPDFKNIVDENLREKMLGLQKTTNILSKETQRLLWKKKYDFRRANESIKEILHISSEKKHTHDQDADSVANKSKGVHDHIDNGDKKICCDLGSDKCSAEWEEASQTAETRLTEGKYLLEKTETVQQCIHVDEKSGAGLQDEQINSCDKPKLFPTQNLCSETENKVSDISIGTHMSGCITDEDVIRLRPEEKKIVDFSGKLYLAPLTTVGNLPFRRICKSYGADVTCGEMALATNLLQGQQSEWALLKRHVSEDLFGVQVCGAFPDTMSRCAQLLNETTDIDFVDINCGCPIDMVYKKGEGCALIGKATRLKQIVHGMNSVLDVPLTLKLRTGIYNNKSVAHTLMPKLRDWGVSQVTLHGRSREQRYTRLADWDYINQCAAAAAPMSVFGNGDVMSFEEYNHHLENTAVSGVMIARGALIKPWIFTEIKEQRHWDISASERLDLLQNYVNFGLEHWGSDHQGVENTRRFLLEWLSFLYRYIPVGILERLPQQINERPPYYRGRNDFETLMASPNCADWIKLSEMFLGPVPSGFNFLPKHRANAYQ